MDIQGTCHCGNLQYRFETQLSPDQLSIRACDCSFCRMHAAKTTSDPDGAVTLRVQDRDRLSRYQFNTQTTTFWICKTCGVYLAALMSVDGQLRATINLRVSALQFRAAAPVSYAHESPEERIQRRLQKWTPAQVIESQEV